MHKFFTLKVNHPYSLGLLSLFSALMILCIIYQTNVQKGEYRANDIFYIWTDGHSIAHGKNPYSRIHGSDMLRNDKYSTYLPGFFLFVSAYVTLGYDSFDEWLSFWRPLNFLIHFTIGSLLFFALMPRGGFWLAIFGAHFWLLSRWPIAIMNSAQIDGAALLVLLISLLLLKKNKKAALVLFGASLSIKQIGIFMLPVYLLLDCNIAKPFLWNLKTALKDLLYISIVPFILCLPFLIWDAKGIILSCIFSATRSPGGHLKVPSIDELLGYVGIIAKFPMLIMMGSIYFLVLEKKVGVFLAGLAIYLSFISFNSVLFKQYMPWFCGFLGLALSEYYLTQKQSSQGQVNAARSD